MKRKSAPSVILREVIDAIPYSVFWKDLGSSYMGCNRRFAKDTGKADPADIIGQDDYAMPWSRDEADFYRKCDQEVMSSGLPLIGIEETQVNAAGERTWLWTSKVPLRSSTGNIFGILGIYADITARKHTEQELVTAREIAVRQLELIRAQQDYLEERNRLLDVAHAELTELQRIMPGALLVIDASGIVRDANDASATLLGFARPEELSGKPFVDFVENAEDALAFGIEAVRQTPNPPRREVELVGKSGDKIPALISVSTLDIGGSPMVVLIAIDLRERKRLELELRQAQKLEAVGRLAAGVAHEINTPVQFVSDSLQFLRESGADLLDLIAKFQRLRDGILADAPLDELRAAASASLDAEAAADLPYLLEEVPKGYARCVDGLSRVSTIVRSMKEFAHPDAREMVTTDLNRAIENTLTIAHNEYKYVADVVTEFGELPPVRCYPGELNQAILNLVVNAAHAIEAVTEDRGQRGRITVRTAAEGSGVLISITDTGNGIPVGLRDRIFDPFFTTKGVGKGTGQGLAIARSVVVDKHHGTLDFVSRVGEGATFFIRLPQGERP